MHPVKSKPLQTYVPALNKRLSDQPTCSAVQLLTSLLYWHVVAEGPAGEGHSSVSTPRSLGQIRASEEKSGMSGCCAWNESMCVPARCDIPWMSKLDRALLTMWFMVTGRVPSK